jgi:hypothetical protein
MGETIFYNYVINHPIGKYYPVGNLEPKYWEEKMKILKNTDIDINKTVAGLVQFIKDTNNDYNF